LAGALWEFTRGGSVAASVVKSSVVRVARAWAVWVPVAGVTTFTGLYFCAASLYPGGSRATPKSIGYSHLSNYWCDLLRQVTQSGAVNPGRPYAVLATFVLPLSLIPLWILMPTLFRERTRYRQWVRGLGSTAMLAATAVFSRWHDLAVNLTASLGLAAVVLTLLALDRREHRWIVGVAVVASLLGITNYAMWQSQLLLWAMPAVQKAAFLSFFAWFFLCCGAIRREFLVDPVRG